MTRGTLYSSLISGIRIYTRSAKAPHARKGRSLRLTGSLFNTSCKLLIVSASILMLFLRKVPISSYAVRVET